jgi:electron-transferring-flavoprotein dehydrogenase
MNEPREEMDFEVVIVGAGPAGLAAALRLKQVAPGVSVAVIEKGADVGAHIISGAVIDPVGLDALLPEWRDETPQMLTPVKEENFFWLDKNRASQIANAFLPPPMTKEDMFVGSLGEVCRYLAQKAEDNDIEVFVGFSATELLLDEKGTVTGIATGDMGVSADGNPGPNYAPGVNIRAKYVLLAEGARGSLTKQAIARFGLESASDPQKYGLGIKEIWELPTSLSSPGLVQHFLGWPLDNRTGGGGFVYHMKDRQVAVGHVVHLDYKNPFTDPFREMQKFKTHPHIRAIVEGGKRVSYGARAISEGGYQSVPELAFPGGALIGDSAGFMNLPRVKGSHNAILSAMLVAEKIGAAISVGRANDLVEGLDNAWKNSSIGRELMQVRNVKPLLSRFGTNAALALGGIDMWFAHFTGRPLFGNMKHNSPDYVSLEAADRHTSPTYPDVDRRLVFDKNSSLYLSGTEHVADQPVHLKIVDMALQEQSEMGVFGGPSAYYCPAGVYEWRERSGSMGLTITAQNCLHCKTCDIKDPNQNIVWTTPEGGDGPNYTNM